MDSFFQSIGAELYPLLATFNETAVSVASTVSTRDIAILSWVGIVVVLILVSRKMRVAAVNLVKSAFSTKLIYVYVVMLIYFGVAIYAMNQLGLFTIYQIKYVSIWFFTVGLIPIIRVKEFQDDIFGKSFALAKSSWTWFALFAFFLGLYPFNFYVEFAGVPIMFFLVSIIAFDSRMRDKRVVNGASFILFGIIIFVVVRTIIDIFINTSMYFNKYVFLNFISVATLTVLYIPFMFAFTLYCAYEGLFLLIDHHVKNRLLALYTKGMAVLFFNFNIRLARRWLRLLVQTMFEVSPEGVASINSTMMKMMRIWRAEKFPKPVPASEGWSPKIARKFLEQYKLIPGDYDWNAGNYFVASSIKSADDINSSNVYFYSYSYSIRGLEGVVKMLDFRMSANSTTKHPEKSETKDQVVNEFLVMSNTLWLRANGTALPEHIADAIRTRSMAQVTVGEIYGQFKYSSLEKWYEMVLVVRAGQWEEGWSE